MGLREVIDKIIGKDKKRNANDRNRIPKDTYIKISNFFKVNI